MQTIQTLDIFLHEHKSHIEMSEDTAVVTVFKSINVSMLIIFNYLLCHLAAFNRLNHLNKIE